MKEKEKKPSVEHQLLKTTRHALHGEPLQYPSLAPLPCLPPYCRDPLTREHLWLCVSILKCTSQNFFRLDKEGRKIPHLQLPYWHYCPYSSHPLGCSLTWAPQLPPWTCKKRNTQTVK